MIALLKLIGSLFYPLSLALIALLAALLCARRWPRGSRGLALFALGWLWLWSTPWIAERAAWTLEREHPPIAAQALPTADAIVLLGGLLDPAQPPAFPEADLNGAADRAWFAAQLWRAGKAPRVICTGGQAPLSRASSAECPDVLRLLRDFGVPETALMAETGSRTTRENARESARMLPADAHVLLVTSARHMPRALSVFQRAGVRATAAATDHVFRPDRPTGISAFIPSAGALALSTGVWHEWLGGLWYVASAGLSSTA